MRALLIAYDNDSLIHYFPLGLAYVASSLREQGHEVEIYSQDLYHWPEEHLTNYLNKIPYDLVGVGMCAGYYQYRKLMKISEAVNKSKRRLYFDYWIGGHLVAPERDFFHTKTHADNIWGVEFDYHQYDSHFPAWDLFPIDYYALMRNPHIKNSERFFPVLSGRGCPFKCNFCYRMTEGYRARSIESIVEEISRLKADYHISYIDFADELFMVSKQRAIELSEALMPKKIHWSCNGRLNYASPEVLKVMKEAGCVFINYGIESVADNVLKNMNKSLTSAQIITGVEATLEAGISPGLNIIWGNIGDTKETLWKSVEFLKKYDDHAQLRTIRPVTPYPGCDLYYEAIQRGLLKGVEDFYENKHINSDLLTVNFTDLTDDEFHTELYKANRCLLSRYYGDLNVKMDTEARELYNHKNVSFRGFRQT